MQSTTVWPNIQEFTYSKRSHFDKFRRFGGYIGIDINLADLKVYQDLLIYNFILDNFPFGARLLEVGGGNSRIIQELKQYYEFWNADKFEGVGNGPKQVGDDQGYRLVSTYMGEFSPEIPENYFDFVFSISTLEHVPENPQTFKNVCDDIERVLKPGGISFHLFDVVSGYGGIAREVWTNKLLLYIFQNIKTANQMISFGEMQQDPDLYVMSEVAYNNMWLPVTQQSYQEFGNPLSYNVLWIKPNIEKNTTAHKNINTYKTVMKNSQNKKGLEKFYADLEESKSLLERLKSELGILDRSKCKKRILVINNIYPPQELGGYGRSISSFAKILEERGHTIKVLSSDASYLGEVILPEANVSRNLLLAGDYNGDMNVIQDNQEIIRINNHNRRVIIDTIMVFKPDVCLIGNIQLLGVEIFDPLLERNIPIIHHLGFVFLQYAVSQKPNSPLYHLAAASEYVKQSILKNYDFDDDISVIYPGAFVQKFYKQCNGNRFDKLRIVYAGIVTRTKGVHTLLEALKIIDGYSDVDFECSIVGDVNYHKSYVETLHNFVSTNNLMDKVKFLGYQSQDQLVKLFSRHNVLVFPSIAEEAFGISPVEAMASGLLVITTGVGGAGEVVEHGVRGLKFPPENSQVLADQLYSLLREPAQSQLMAQKGQRRALRLFDVNRSVDMLENKFDELLRAATGKSIVQESNKANSVFNNNDKITGNALIVREVLPKIAVVTPSYNQSEFLEECIDSVLSQGYPNLDYIIMDGGSTDGSLSIIKKYEKYLTYWQSKPDGGQYVAISEGFKKTAGEVMAWLNSDDKYHPDSLFKVAAVFRNYPQMEWLMGRPTTFQKSGILDCVISDVPLWSREYILSQNWLSEKVWIQQESVFWKRSLWERSGGGLRLDLKVAGDFELWLRFSRYAQLFFVDTLLGGFRNYESNRSKLLWEKYMQEIDQALNEELMLIQMGQNKTLLPPPPIIYLDDSEWLTLKNQVVVNNHNNDDEVSSLRPNSSLEESQENFSIDKPTKTMFNKSLNKSVSKTNYKVSAIISTYNSEKFIRGRLDNLVNQTLYTKGQVEIIVIDSNSEQNERSIVKEFQNKYPHIIYERTPNRETIYAAWNRGIKMCHGKYVINANADDRFGTNALEIMVNKLDDDSHLSAVYGDWLITAVENDSFDSNSEKFYFSYPESLPPLLLYYQITTHAALIKKSVFDQIGYYRDDMKVFGDRDFMLRFYDNGLMAQKISDIVGLYYENLNSVSMGEVGQIAVENEYKPLRENYLQTENLCRLFGYNSVVDNSNLAQLYAVLGAWGKDCYIWKTHIVSDLVFAEKVFFKALELDQTNCLALNNLGIIRATQGNYQQATEMLNLALQHSNSDKQNIHNNIAAVNNQCNTFADYCWVKPSMPMFVPTSQLTNSSTLEKPLVSVIIPTKDRPEMLTQAIQSVLNQTFTELEIIVVNDGGLDVQSVISRLNTKGNIIYKKHDRALDRSAARNTGIRAVRGKYIAYLDDDDNYYPNHIETLVKFLENSEYKIAYTDAVMAEQKKENDEYVTVHRSVPYSLDFDKDKILVSNCTPNLCLMHEKSCLDEVGLFDETLSTHEDWDLIIRLSRQFDIAHIKETTCEFTQRNDGTNTSTNNRVDFPRTREIIYNRYRQYAEANPTILEAQKDAFILEAKELAQQLQNLQSQLQQNQAEKSQLAAQVETLQRSTQEAQAKLEATQSEKEWVKSQLNSWKQTAEEMQLELDRSRSKLKQAQLELDRSAFPLSKS